MRSLAGEMQGAPIQAKVEQLLQGGEEKGLRKRQGLKVKAGGGCFGGVS